jgi:CRISPR-associated exonuclease Cas4
MDCSKHNNTTDFIPLSALQHILYCERQFALIHLEQIWEDNRFTAEGEVLHERVHRERAENRKTFREEYGMAVQSKNYGLTGKCDLVEMWFSETAIHKGKPSGRPDKVNPVEFKRGKRKTTDVDNVQLCAQAICLEEMFETSISSGQFYYFSDHRRTTVELTEPLREKTIELARKCEYIIDSGKTPLAVYEKKKCDNCSLINVCMPNYTAKSVQKYIQRELDAI